MLTMPDFGAAVRHEARVVCDSTITTPLQLRPLELGCDVASTARRKSSAGTMTSSPASSSSATTGCMSACARPAADGRGRIGRHRLAAAPRARDAGGARSTADRNRPCTRRAARRARSGDDGALPRVWRPCLLRRRGRRGSSPRRDRRAADRERDQPRRHAHEARVARHRWEGERCPPGCCVSPPGSSPRRSSGRTSSGRLPAQRSERLSSRSPAASTGCVVPRGRAWLDALPRLVASCVERWGLTLGPPFADAYVSFPLPAGCRTAVTRCSSSSFPHRESDHEAEALARWDGDGAVRLLAHDAGRSAPARALPSRARRSARSAGRRPRRR